jgi:hypothetical protein
MESQDNHGSGLLRRKMVQVVAYMNGLPIQWIVAYRGANRKDRFKHHRALLGVVLMIGAWVLWDAQDPQQVVWDAWLCM